MACAWPTPVLTVVRLAGDYWPTAVHFCNQRLFDSLSCTLLLHPSVREEEEGQQQQGQQQ